MRYFLFCIIFVCFSTVSFSGFDFGFGLHSDNLTSMEFSMLRYQYFFDKTSVVQLSADQFCNTLFNGHHGDIQYTVFSTEQLSPFVVAEYRENSYLRNSFSRYKVGVRVAPEMVNAMIESWARVAINVGTAFDSDRGWTTAGGYGVNLYYLPLVVDIVGYYTTNERSTFYFKLSVNINERISLFHQYDYERNDLDKYRVILSGIEVNY